jgi:hypothetical protein
MSDQPDEETRTEPNGDDDEGRPSLQRETRATGHVDTFSASNGDRADNNRESEETVEDVEIEVVLLSNDEEEGDLPRVLTDGGSHSFRWYMLAPGVVAAGVATALLLKFRAPQQSSRLRAGLNGASAVTSSLPDLSGIGKGLGSVAGDQKARAQALAAQAKARVGKMPPAKKKSAWEEARDTTQDIMRDHMATIVALAASVGLTIAARLIDVKREGTLPLPTPPKKAWYQIGPWS